VAGTVNSKVPAQPPDAARQPLPVALSHSSAPAHRRPRCFSCGAVLPAWCDRIPTPAENQLYPYSGHSCAHRHPHGFGKLFIEGRQITENRSCYEYHPPGPSKTVRTAVGRSIFPADSFGRTSKPAAGARELADCSACQIKRKTRRVEAAGLRPSPTA
jgi:hypothetical protein